VGRVDGWRRDRLLGEEFQLRRSGFYWRSVWGYRGSYPTAYNNGDYEIYALDSGVGQFDHSYASGQPDSGSTSVSTTELAPRSYGLVDAKRAELLEPLHTLDDREPAQTVD
jgi:hypothetical protein